MTTQGDPCYTADGLAPGVRAVVAELNAALTAALVTALVGVKETGQTQRWVAGEQSPSSEHEAILRFAHTVWRRLEGGMGRHAAQAWMTSANSFLGERTPITAIRERQRQAVLAAAEAALRDAFAG